MDSNTHNTTDTKTDTSHKEHKQHHVITSTSVIQEIDSPHVKFANKLPSIISTPIYDDSSSVVSSTYTVTTSNVASPLVVSTQLPISRQVSERRTVTKTTKETTSSKVFESKVMVDGGIINKEITYGPVFKEEDITVQTTVTENTSLSKDFESNITNQEEKHEHYNYSSKHTDQQSTPKIMPPPEQSRVNTFIKKIKGYKQFSNINLSEEEEGRYHDEKNIKDISSKDSDIYLTLSKKRGLLYRQLFGDAVYPVFTWFLALAMIGSFIYELVRNEQLSGNLIQTSPFNPMIGPNYAALINMGSKFVPCMTNVTKYPPSYPISNCYTSNESCTIEDLCGFGGFHGEKPNQSFRFALPIILHAGVVHLLLNLLAHCQLGGYIERSLGVIRFTILYVGSGVWGFILSATLSGSLSSSMGCSGALFGLLGYEIVNSIVSWNDIRSPRWHLFKLFLVVLIALLLGLFPGLDNFAHIGGLVMGLLLSTLLVSTRPFSSRIATIFTWISKFLSFGLAILFYALFIMIFYTAEDLDNVCPNCKYLSCIPINGWCDVSTV